MLLSWELADSVADETVGVGRLGGRLGRFVADETLDVGLFGGCLGLTAAIGGSRVRASSFAKAIPLSPLRSTSIAPFPAG